MPKEAIEAITLILNKKILDHFAYEEQAIPLPFGPRPRTRWRRG